MKNDSDKSIEKRKFSISIGAAASVIFALAGAVWTAEGMYSGLLVKIDNQTRTILKVHEDCLTFDEHADYIGQMQSLNPSTKFPDPFAVHKNHAAMHGAQLMEQR